MFHYRVEVIDFVTNIKMMISDIKTTIMDQLGVDYGTGHTMIEVVNHVIGKEISCHNRSCLYVCIVQHLHYLVAIEATVRPQDHGKSKPRARTILVLQDESLVFAKKPHEMRGITASILYETIKLFQLFNTDGA